MGLTKRLRSLADMPKMDPGRLVSRRAPVSPLFAEDWWKKRFNLAFMLFFSFFFFSVDSASAALRGNKEEVRTKKKR